ncbi:unnamed protein product [Discosporangium mesarthrocarpum]
MDTTSSTGSAAQGELESAQRRTAGDKTPVALDAGREDGRPAEYGRDIEGRDKSKVTMDTVDSSSELDATAGDATAEATIGEREDNRIHLSLPVHVQPLNDAAADGQGKPEQPQKIVKDEVETISRSMVPDKEDGDFRGDGGNVKLQNYASRDSGAVVLEGSPGSKGMDNLLVDSKDKYAISSCEDKQWVVLGLSEDILVRTIKISSNEKFSSLVKSFQVLASQTFPVNEWLDLGTFTAKYAQGEQSFDVPHPAFARCAS